MKETVKERAILQEKITEGRINGKNAMTVSDINELKGHRGSSVNGIHVTAGRTETGMTAERNILKLPQEGQVYMAPPKEGSPQLIIFSTFSMTESRGC